MNILPSIKARNKSFHFSNPLSGVTYNNNDYLSGCNYESNPQKSLTININQKMNSKKQLKRNEMGKQDQKSLMRKRKCLQYE